MPDARQRIDRWLFFARVVKSRSLAAKLAQAGRVRINGDKATQPADPVRIGDALTITLERRILIYRVRGCGVRRGPPDEARTLYDDLSPPPPGPAASTALAAPRDVGSGRPTKKQRRQTDRLRADGDT